MEVADAHPDNLSSYLYSNHTSLFMYMSHTYFAQHVCFLLGWSGLG